MPGRRETLLERTREAQAARIAPLIGTPEIDLDELILDDFKAAIAVLSENFLGARKGMGTGTGFFITGDGYIVTNAHVVEGCDTPMVVCGLKGPIPAHVLARDTVSDLAILKVETESAHIATLRTNVRIGEEIAIFGYPLLDKLSAGGNFTIGNVSALAGIKNDSGRLQITAPVQPGNSGGPVLDRCGNVIGVVVARLADYTQQNVNFAIKISVLTEFLNLHEVPYSTEESTHPLQRVELAENAQSIAVLIQCEK